MESARSAQGEDARTIAREAAVLHSPGPADAGPGFGLVFSQVGGGWGKAVRSRNHAVL